MFAVINPVKMMHEMFESEMKKLIEKDKKEHEKCPECLFSLLQAFVDLGRN